MATRAKGATALGVLLVTFAVAYAVAVVALSRGKTFLNVGAVRAIALGVAAAVALVGAGTAWRAGATPRPGSGSSPQLSMVSLGFDGLVCVSLPGIVTHVGAGRFCSIGAWVSWFVLATPIALLAALGLHIGAMARARRLASAAVGVLLAALPMMTFLLARLADRFTCGD